MTEPASNENRTPSIIVRRLRIHGLVQGVYYRHSTIAVARRLQLSGWVRNRQEGHVEALVAGPPQEVEALIAWAHQGPEAARVERVDVSQEDPALAGALQGFVQRETL